MKISFLVDDISLPGGAERVICNVANFLHDECKVDVEIVTITQKNLELFYFLDKNIKITNLCVNTRKNIFLKIIDKIRIVIELRKINSDIYMGVGTLSTFLLYLSIKKTKIFAYEHIEFDSINTKLKYIRSYIYKKIKGIICLTSIDMEKYKQLSKNVYLIPNFLSFYPKENSTLENKKILSVGRLTKRKGFDMLVKALDLIKFEISSWKIDIIGEGEEKENLLKLIKEKGLDKNISILDPTREILNNYLNTSIYVLPSIYEGFGMVLAEAMSCGVPCVSFDCPTGPKDIIKDKEDGFLIEEKNIEKLAEAIKKLVNDEKLRKCMGKKAKINILKYSKEKISEDWREFLKKEKIN